MAVVYLNGETFPSCHLVNYLWIKLLPGGLELLGLSVNFLTHYSVSPDRLKALMHGCQIQAALKVMKINVPALLCYC